MNSVDPDELFQSIQKKYFEEYMAPYHNDIMGSINRTIENSVHYDGFAKNPLAHMDNYINKNIVNPLLESMSEIEIDKCKDIPVGTLCTLDPNAMAISLIPEGTVCAVVVDFMFIQFLNWVLPPILWSLCINEDDSTTQAYNSMQIAYAGKACTGNITYFKFLEKLKGKIPLVWQNWTGA